MLKVNVGSAYDPMEVIVPETITVREAFREVSLNLTMGMIVTVNAKRLGDDDLDKTLAQVGIKDGDLVTANEKTSGAIIR